MYWISLAAFIGIVVLTALFGGQWAANDWYRNLRKPSFTPPNWAFPVAWSVLYLMIAIAGWFVWLAPPGVARSAALTLWGGQIFINAIWSYIFFGAKQMDVALTALTAMWALIAFFIIAAWPVDHRAAVLFVPYLVWVSYAGVLNGVILRMNPQ